MRELNSLASFGLCLLVLGGLHCGAAWRLPKAAEGTQFLVGAGIADVTGPAAGVGMMGMANPAQIGHGIHLRQFARAFVLSDIANQTRAVFVNVDCGMIDQLVKTEVVRRLQARYGETLYTAQNVLLSGTHTHSGPAGFLQYLLFGITNFGFVEQSFEALVTGTILSIERAQARMEPSTISYSKGDLINANINRSPAAYLMNPQEERDRYAYDTDKEMLLLKFEGADGKPIGMINWYAVHLTSMNNTNKLISSDNKGYSMQLFENVMNPAALPGKGEFVAAFAQSNLGDVSPNTAGPRCIDTGLPCDFHTSTCNNRTKLCIAFGPGKDMTESTKIIGERQFTKAWELYNSQDMTPLVGELNFIHQFVNMTDYTLNVTDRITGETKTVKLCKPAMGFSFAAGCTDGPGAFDFTQGMTDSNPFWNHILPAIHAPSQEMIECQSPKPVLLATGEINEPFPWQPAVVETQILQIGQLLILAVPGEFTTMSGRRLREAVLNAAIDAGAPEDTFVVIAGLSNTYADYITTYEEYQMQRYEAASTIFGPHTLEAYIDQYKKLTKSMLTHEKLPPGPDPPYLLKEQLSFVPGPVFDHAPAGKNFGDCTAQPFPLVYLGETVRARFVAGHPRNNLMLEDTFLTVERQEEDGSWTVVATDASWETTFIWERTSLLFGESEVTVSWETSESTPAGTYRIQHFGYHRDIKGNTYPYSGTTEPFLVQAKRQRRLK